MITEKKRQEEHASDEADKKNEIKIIRQSLEAHDISAIRENISTLQNKHRAALPELFKNSSLTADQIAILFKRQNSLIYLAYLANDQKTPIGYIYAEARTIPETPLTNSYQSLHIHHLNVQDGQKRRGIASKLIETARSDAMQQLNQLNPATEQMPFRQLRLTADYFAFNKEAEQFFKKQNLTPYIIKAWQL